MSEPDAVTQIAYDAAHVAEGEGQVYRQFANAARLQGLLAAWLAQVQQVEDALWDLLACTLASAKGAALEQLGALLGFARGGLASDNAYRAVLRGVVLARRSSGRADELIAVMTAAYGATTFAYTEGRASVRLEPHTPIGFDARALLAVLLIAKAGGVELQLLAPPTDASLLYAYAPDPLRLTNDATGLANTAQSTGGHLTGVVS